MNEQHKILFAVGGTGGHVFPALKLAKQLDRHIIHFIGVGLDRNVYYDNSFPAKSISGATPSIRKPLSLFKILKGLIASLRWIWRTRPDVIIGFGSYHSFPPLLAAKIARIPYVLFEANAIPGKVIRHLSKKAVFTAVQFPHCKELLQGETKEVSYLSGIPDDKSYTKAAAKEAYGLDPQKKTLLIFGGSQGSEAINAAMEELAKGYSLSLQVLHIVGTKSARVIYAYGEAGIESYVKPFEKNMAAAWAAADIAICRAGASSIAEHVHFEVPCIFIPYPKATGDHQLLNALYATKVIKGSEMIPESMLSANGLYKLLEKCSAEEERYRKSIQLYKKTTHQTELHLLVSQFLTPHA